MNEAEIEAPIFEVAYKMPSGQNSINTYKL